MLLYPIVSSLNGFQKITIGLTYDLWIVLILFLFTFIVGIIAGLIPALTVLKFKELDMLNNIFRNRIAKTGLSFRKIIIVIQFSASMGLILFAYTLLMQTKYMADADYGFDYSNTLSIKVSNQQEYNSVRDEFSKFKEVNSMSFISTNLGYMPTEILSVWAIDRDHKVELSTYYIDENTIKDLGIKLVDGVNFSNNSSLNKSGIILNQQALKVLEISDFSKTGINVNDTTAYQVIGAVKDFHFQNFKQAILPMAFIYKPDHLGYSATHMGYLNLKIQAGKIDLIQEHLTDKEFLNLAGNKLESIRWDEVYRGIQSHPDSISVILYLTATLVLIACLGLIAVITFTIQQRFKEVMVRKIIGANYFQVFKVLTKEYLILLIISLMIGGTFGFLISNAFLTDYAYRIKLNILFYTIPFLLYTLICISILTMTTWKACREKPVNNLKTE